MTSSNKDKNIHDSGECWENNYMQLILFLNLIKYIVLTMITITVVIRIIQIVIMMKTL